MSPTGFCYGNFSAVSPVHLLIRSVPLHRLSGKAQESSNLEQSEKTVFGLRANRLLRFGSFEADLSQRELRHCGVRVNLQKKPFQVLELLLEHPGKLVTRAEFAERLWPGLYVSFDGGLNTAVNALRHALDDSACSVIETRPGLGYRFTAPVEEVSSTQPHSEARQDYLKGRFLQRKATEADLGKSVAHFESAIRHDPGYALAFLGLADTYILFAQLGSLSPAAARSRADPLVSHAISIESRLAEGHVTLARIRTLFDWNCTAAEEEYVRALALSPDCVDAYRFYAALLSALGRPAESFTHIRKALELDPLSLAIRAELAWISYLARDFEESIRQSWQALILEPDFAPAHYTLGLAHEQAGSLDDAITELQNARSCSAADIQICAALAHAGARSGNHPQARRILEELASFTISRYVSPCALSLVHLGLGETEVAFSLLEQAFEERDLWLVWAGVDPRFDSLRPDPRFARLCAALASSHQLR